MFQNLNPGAVGIRCGWIEGLDLAAKAGFGGADLNLGEAKKLADEKGLDAVTALYTDRGLKMGGWGLPVQWRGDDEEFYEGLAKLPELSKLAGELGCHRTTTVCIGWHDELTREQHWHRAVHRLRCLGEILKVDGHRLGLEFIGPHTSRMDRKYGFVYTMDGMLALGLAVGTGNIGLLFDVWHWYACQSTLADVRHLTAEEVVYVHINDAPAGIDVLDQMDLSRCLPGETGIIPNGELLGILRDMGFDGPVTAEPFSQKVRDLASADQPAAAKMVKESLDKVWAEAGLG